jgi:hypothetical protein
MRGAVADKRKVLPALPFVSAMATAMLLTACDNPNRGWTTGGPTKTCIDNAGRRLLDQSCRGGRSGSHWYYYGSGGSIPAVGDRVSGGSYAPSPGVTYEASGVARRGFGRIGGRGGGGE